LKSNRSDEARPAGLRYAAMLEQVRPRLGPFASRVLHVETVGSTNDIALDEARHASAAEQTARVEGLVVVADQQTAGRGRRGHAWFSPPGAGLYVSVVLAPSRAQVDPRRATLLTTIAAGVAVAEGIGSATALRADLKWPNDLYVSQRKLGGILAESAGADLVVVGYGINVAAAALPPELRGRATSIEAELGRAIEREVVLIETLAALAARYGDLMAGRFDAILDAWRLRAPGASGARVSWTVSGRRLSGVTEGIADDGALLVRVAGRVERIVAGEVIWS
jgi:BirA family biotin operon repressor/biotin-[acetyl-CoA-carboxylase] ligase